MPSTAAVIFHLTEAPVANAVPVPCVTVALRAVILVAKYVPYGPVKEVMPYLLRRAQENTSVAGQTGRELTLIISERNRRKLK